MLFPASQVASATFGGEGCADMYVTTGGATTRRRTAEQRAVSSVSEPGLKEYRSLPHVSAYDAVNAPPAPEPTLEWPSKAKSPYRTKNTARNGNSVSSPSTKPAKANPATPS